MIPVFSPRSPRHKCPSWSEYPYAPWPIGWPSGWSLFRKALCRTCVADDVPKSPAAEPLRDAASLLLLFARIVVCNNAFNGTAHTSTAPVHFPCDRKSGCKKSFLKIFTKNRRFTLCSVTFRPWYAIIMITTPPGLCAQRMHTWGSFVC